MSPLLCRLLRVAIAGPLGIAVFGALLVAGAPVHAQGPIHPDAESVEPLAVGSRGPAVSVLGVEGGTRDLAALVAEQGALLVFYRGGW